MPIGRQKEIYLRTKEYINLKTEELNPPPNPSTILRALGLEVK